jgi:hypothetical protein
MWNRTEAGKQKVRERKKLTTISLRLTQDEAIKLDDLVAASGFRTRSAFLIARALADGAPVQPPPRPIPPELAELKPYLSGIANHIMQIARALNTAALAAVINNHGIEKVILKNMNDFECTCTSINALARKFTRSA